VSLAETTKARPAAPVAESPTERVRTLVQRALGDDASFGPAQALASARTSDVSHFLHARFDGTAGLDLLGVGIPASPGAASGRVVLSSEEAIAAADRGESVILVRRETTPDDVLGMQSARGILTARGGLASHAAVVARGWGIPAVVGFEALSIDDAGISVDGRRVAAGERISLDGHTGQVFAGGSDVSTDAAPPELEVLLGWADQLRSGHFAVRANVDDATAAAHARELGAEGVGLCRTEHMFLADDRLPLVRRLILSDDPAEDAAALAELEVAQQEDFEALFAAMDGLPVTVRLLDPPLHEFLPGLEPLVVAEATGTLTAEQRAELAAVRRLHEANPMIGTRGVRLGVIKPDLYPMQVRAICRAVTARLAAGGHPHVEVMIPLVVDATELHLARRWVEEAEAAVHTTGAGRQAISVGTMIETPRAAVVAASLAGAADFFSFGTNDLTQLTFAFSRDDVEAKLLPQYLEAGMLPANPFEVLDQPGVGFLVRHAVDEARAVAPQLKIGACGEQAGDPGSARFLVGCGLDYVSCSPYRLPVVRLAVAQALLALGLADGAGLSMPAVPAGFAPLPGSPLIGGAAGAPTAEGAPGWDAAELTFRILHALKIKGFAAARTVAELAGVGYDDTDAELDRLRQMELVRFLDARSLWGLTPAGRTHHADLLPGAPVEAIDCARAVYPRFVELNVRFKELCSAWQLRDGNPNDHTDAAYDGARIAELGTHDLVAASVLDAMATAVPRLGLYRPRLQGALDRLTAGERDLFTGVMKNSYHDIWMELHEDLLSIFGIDRTAEGSF
jgi:phosphoenolpyruvate-protein kinase (PTS system EI component)